MNLYGRGAGGLALISAKLGRSVLVMIGLVMGTAVLQGCQSRNEAVDTSNGRANPMVSPVEPVGPVGTVDGAGGASGSGGLPAAGGARGGGGTGAAGSGMAGGVGPRTLPERPASGATAAERQGLEPPLAGNSSGSR